jgi:hypothetical protein
MPDPKYVCIKITNIPQEFIDEYKLVGPNRDGWISKFAMVVMAFHKQVS